MKLTVLIHGLLAITSAGAFAGYSVDVRLDKSEGFYKVGDESVCTATLMNDGKPAVGEKLRCTVKRERDILRRDEFLCEGKAVTVRASMDRPGWLFFGFEIIGPDGNPLQGEGIFKHRMKPTIVGEIGAMYDADKITALDSRPADFDAYWTTQRAAGRLWQDRAEWTRKAVLNTARMGWFSADRAILDYAREIWNAEPGER